MVGEKNLASVVHMCYINRHSLRDNASIITIKNVWLNSQKIWLCQSKSLVDRFVPYKIFGCCNLFLQPK